ncbi:MAG: GAF domain-containing protein, partial [Candidatus Latescibacteria bacterium]|nr:GAF domain-containing protein [Candidatus Latescibacterota bacterium]
MATAQSQVRGKKALLFTDDSESATLIGETLAGDGIVTELARNGYASFDSLMEFTPDIIIADLNYSEISGFTILDGIKAKKLRMPVIIIGAPSADDIITVFRSGAADFLKKPLDPGDIHDSVLSILTVNAAEIDGIDKDNISTLLKNVERNNRELTNLLKISSSLDISSDSREILNRLTELAAESMNCEAASILLINDRKNVLEFVVATGEKKQRISTISLPMGEGIAGWVAVNGEPQIVNETSTDPRFTGRIDKQSGFVTRQILAVPLKLDQSIIGVLEVINARDNRVLDDDDMRMLTEIGARAATIIATAKTIESQQNFYVQTTNIIVKAIEKKDMYTEGHPWRVAELCHMIAVEKGLGETDKSDLHYGALFHDIGKLDMPSILFNRRTLSDREREFMRQHPVKGAKLLEPITLWNNIVPYVLYHHESWDGSGYPFGRSGEDIPLGARIINLAESFAV